MELLGFVAKLGVVQHELRVHREHSVVKSAKMIQEEAKGALGTYKYGWPALAPSTVERKATGDSPLLETGGLRDSIEYNATHGLRQSDADVGTDDQKGIWMTEGTSRGVPPRPFMEPAAREQEHHIEKEFHDNVVVKAFRP